jgi:hypothetical protein
MGSNRRIEGKTGPVFVRHGVKQDSEQLEAGSNVYCK